MEKAKGKATKCLWDRTIRKKNNYGESNKGLMQKIADTFERRLVVVTEEIEKLLLTP